MKKKYCRVSWGSGYIDILLETMFNPPYGVKCKVNSVWKLAQKYGWRLVEHDD